MLQRARGTEPLRCLRHLTASTAWVGRRPTCPTRHRPPIGRTPSPQLRSPPVDTSLRDLVARALAEDVGAGDITAEAVVPEDAVASARIVQKEPGAVFGLDA